MKVFKKVTSVFVAVSFFIMTVCPVNTASAQSISQILPQGAISPSIQTFNPVMIEGIKLYANDPLKFDFIINTGDAALTQADSEKEVLKLSRYFLAALTVPQDQMWVNLSPYEKDRIVPDTLGRTEMGRDMLAQDYLLKQMTSTLISPENEYGRKFWDRIYKEARERFGVADLPTDSFSKVWIIPDQAKIYSHNNTVYVASSHLKVMQQNDYQALSQKLGVQETGISSQQQDMDAVSSKIFQEIVIPQLENEVNNGEHFAPLRQIFRALIFATWYKSALQQTLLGRQYVNQQKIDGVSSSKEDIQAIYQQYVKAFESGVANMITEEYDPATQQMVPKQYFTGGENLTEIPSDLASLAEVQEHQGILVEGIQSGRIGAAGIKFDNAQLDAKVKTDYENVFGALKQAFPGKNVLMLPTTSTRKIDTRINGDNRNRAPALDIVRDSKTGARVRELPAPMDETSEQNPGIDYDFMFAPIVIKQSDIPEGLRAAATFGSDKKKLSAAVADYLQKVFKERDIQINDQSLRSTADALNQARRDNVNFIFDKLSMIAIVAPSGDLLVKVPFWFLRDEEAAQDIFNQPIAEALVQRPTVEIQAPDFNNLLSSVKDMDSALEVLGANSLFLYDALTDNNPTAIKVMIKILSQLDVNELINPDKYGIQLDADLGRFVSSLDDNGFGKNLKQFLMSLSTVDILLLNLNNMLMPTYDGAAKKGVAVDDQDLQNAAVSFFYRLYNRMMELGDTQDYEPLRLKVMDFADRLNAAVRESDAVDIQSVIQDNGVALAKKVGADEKQAQALSKIAQAYQGKDAWAESVMRLAHVVDETTFVRAFRSIHSGTRKAVKPSEKLKPVIFGSGRIANAAFAIRLVQDLSAEEEGFVGNYSLQSRTVAGNDDSERFQNAASKVREMLDDDVVKNAGFKIKNVQVSDLLAQGRLTVEAGKEKLSAKTDYIIDIPAPSVYPVNIVLDGQIVATVYYVNVEEYAKFMSGDDIRPQAEAKAKAAGFDSLDNIPRPLIIVNENGEDVLFSEIMDGTPGGVYVGNGTYEFEMDATGKKRKIKETPSLWEHGAYQKINDGTNELGEKDELARFREVTRQFNLRLQGRPGFFDVEQIMSKMVLPSGGGVNFLSNNIGKLPRVNESGITVFTPLSCSSNGASHILFALISALGLGKSLLAVIADTGHMYTGGDKGSPFGHLYPKATGAAKGVEAALPIEAHFTSVRTATGLVDGETDIVGGSEFDLFGQLPYQADSKLIGKWLKRIADESPEFLALFSKNTGEDWNFSWKENISGQSTGSILMGDIEIIDGNIFRQSAGYDNEWSFSTADARARKAFVDALRAQQNTQMILDAVSDNASLVVTNGGVNFNAAFFNGNANLKGIPVPFGSPDIEKMSIQGGLVPVLINYQVITSPMTLGLDDKPSSDEKSQELSLRHPVFDRVEEYV